jgi:hypothetical protein
MALPVRVASHWRAERNPTVPDGRSVSLPNTFIQGMAVKVYPPAIRYRFG